MKAKKVLLTTLLVAAVGFSAACSNNGGNNGGNGNEGATATNKPAAETEKPADIVQLKAITMGTEPASGMDNFYKQLDELTIKDLGMTIRFDFIPWGDEKNQISRAIVAKEYDVYVGGGFSDFSAFAAKNAFADLTPLLEKTPALVEHYKGSLERVKLDGKVFGIPQYNKPGAGGQGVLYREDLRKEWGLPEIKNLATLEQYLYKAKEQFSGVPMINDKRFADNLWTMLAGDKYFTVTDPYTVASQSEPYKAISKFDTPEFKLVIEKAKQWYEDGIVDHDILAGQGNETSKTLELMKANQKPLEFNNHFGAVSSGYIGALKTAFPEQEFGWLDFTYDMFPNTVFLPRMSAATTTMISIGSHSKHAELALKFIEKAHTDQTYYNLLMFGVEGENYKLTDTGLNYEGIDDKNKKPGWTGLIDGYMQPEIAYPGEWQAFADKLTKTEGPALAEKNGPDPYEGFVFNSSELQAENASLETVKTQYIQPLSVGVTNNIDKDLAEVQKQLKGAGLEKYMTTLQAQLDAFSATK
ncbi:DUF3502 domain-containing protein [Paenibacillus sp. YIM B09110]|uniref:DUF3502 domain-containing protein n=1 Tax=Paenibacillus sp. YIM B09110 TaxID=3126102 RepID=UPI00301DAFF3